MEKVLTEATVHIRRFAFDPPQVAIRPGGRVTFVHGGDADEAHCVVVADPLDPQAARSSPCLRRGARWDYEVPRENAGGGAGGTRFVYDPLWSFMTASLRIVPRSESMADLGKPKETIKYADSFVYAAANNQLSIVRKRLGLDHSQRPGEQVGSHLLIGNVDAEDSEGMSALQAAAKGGHCGVIEVLLDAGAAVEHQGGGKQATALAFASEVRPPLPPSCTSLPLFSRLFPFFFPA